MYLNKKKIKKILNLNKKKTKASRYMVVPTWAPIFNGFYESVFNGSDCIIENYTELMDECEYKEMMPELYNAGVPFQYYKENISTYIDFSNCYKDAAESICLAILDLDHSNIIIDIEFEKLISPKFYNFSTDSINCKIKYNPKKLKEYIENNYEAFKRFISDRYTSRDGFIPWYSNSVSDWLNTFDYGEHQLGSVLEFVIINNHGSESEAILDLYYKSHINEVFHNSVEIDINGLINEYSRKVS